MARSLLRPPPVRELARADDARRRRRAPAGERACLSADRLVPGDGGLGAAGRGGARARGGPERDPRPRGRRAVGGPATRRLLAELPRQITRSRRNALEDD